MILPKTAGGGKFISKNPGSNFSLAASDKSISRSICVYSASYKAKVVRSTRFCTGFAISRHLSIRRWEMIKMVPWQHHLDRVNAVVLRDNCVTGIGTGTASRSIEPQGVLLLGRIIPPRNNQFQQIKSAQSVVAGIPIEPQRLSTERCLVDLRPSLQAKMSGRSS